MEFSNSFNAFKEAQKVIPGGVNSPVRAFKSVQTDPVFIKKGLGSRVFDVDGNEFIDFVSSWGPLIFGHAHPTIISAIKNAADEGTSYGAPTLLETELAKLIVDFVPSIEKVRMVNSGTEATMSAIRLARGYTGRNLFVKFEGNYHGHGDGFLIKAGSGAITFGQPDSSGVTQGIAGETLIAEYNNIESVKALFREKGKQIAAVIVEPVAGNMGVVPPVPGFLEGLREITKDNGSLLIFDEVISGFRLGKGGAQKLFNIQPDITTLGKIIGGGLPVGAYGGRKEIMEKLAPVGHVYQAGTLSGNPLAMAAGIATLQLIQNTPDLYSELERKSAKLEDGIKNNLEMAKVKGTINRVGSIMTLFFNKGEQVVYYADAIKSDTQKFANYFKVLLAQGIYSAPSQFECLFVSYALSDKELNKYLEANLKAIKEIKL